MIGGIDIILTAPGRIPVTDLIIGRMREFWPDGRFQEADSSDVHRLSESWVSTIGSSSHEFFVFRDTESAAAWEKRGAVEDNSNTMLHFLVGDPKSEDCSLREVTVVCDELTAGIQLLISDLQRTFFPALIRLAA